MESAGEIFAVLVGWLLRIGLPLAVTVLVVWWMRRMDERWKAQAEREQALAGVRVQARNTGCWDVHQCPPERRAACPAYADPDRPCWQVFRQADGRLRERCLLCSVFRRAPVPA
jgi:hypothetical protein